MEAAIFKLLKLRALLLCEACISLALHSKQTTQQGETMNNTDTRVSDITPSVTASCKLADMETAMKKANDKAAKAADAKKAIKGKLDAAQETIRLLEAQIQRTKAKAGDVEADFKRIETAISTIKNIRRMNKGDSIPAESLTYLEEDLTEEYTLGIEHQS